MSYQDRTATVTLSENSLSDAFIDAGGWALSVNGSGVMRAISFSYYDLLKFPAKIIEYQNPCTDSKPGSRAGRVVRWQGVPVQLLLDLAGVKRSARCIICAGVGYRPLRRQIPIEKAMDSNTIVAYMMNGKILSADRGFPARLIVPGWDGVVSVKCLDTVIVSERMSPALGQAVRSQRIKSPFCPCVPFGSLPSGGS